MNSQIAQRNLQIAQIHNLRLTAANKLKKDQLFFAEDIIISASILQLFSDERRLCTTALALSYPLHTPGDFYSLITCCISMVAMK